MSADLFVVIPVHNNRVHTLHCLECLYAQTLAALRIVLIDDGSVDGTSESVRELYPDVEILQGDGNLWWTGSVAKGVEWILDRAQPADLVLTLNNDTRFEPNFVERLLSRCLREGRALVASSCVSSVDGKPMDAAGTFFWESARRAYSRELLEQQTVDFQFLTSRAVLYPVEVFRQIGNFNHKALPHYHADMEFTNRARRHGFRLVLDLDVYLTVTETPETSGDQFVTGEYLSLSQAWRVFSSPCSSFYPPSMFRYIDLCCPPGYRLRNKLSFLAGSLSNSFGRTRPGAQLVRLLRRCLRRP